MDDLESLQKLFDEKKIAPELFDAAKTLVEAEKQRGIKESQKANKEAEKFRKAKIAFEMVAKDLGIDKLDDPESVAAEILSKHKNAADKGSTVEGQVKALQKRLDDADKEKQDLISKNRSAGIRSKVASEFEKRLYSHGLHLDNLIAKGRLALADDGEDVVWKSGDDEVEFKTGFEKYVAENKDSAKNISKPGAKSSGSSPKGKQANTITQADFDAMKPKEKAKFFAEGGVMAAE